ncbi:MAG: glycine cleavage system protein GcvH [Dehalococcoidia bacterium]
MNPSDRKYSKEHEWAKVEDDGRIVVGITHFAQDQLGDIVFLDLPAPGTRVEQHKKLGEVESVKAVSDLFSPVGGEVVEVNQAAVDNPELVNNDPFEAGWLVKMSSSNSDKEMGNLLTSEEYETFLESEAH